MGDRANFVDDSGETRLAGELVYPDSTPTDVLTVQSDGSIAAAPGGGSSASVKVLGPFPFVFDTAGLAAGVAVYTPTVDDILLDAWIEVDTAWDGTTPLCDIGTFVGDTGGIFAGANLPIAMDGAADGEPSGAGILFNSHGINGRPVSLVELGASSFGVGRYTPARFTAANPVKVVVSQDGTAGGAAPGAMQGAARLYLVVATPSLT